MDTKAFRRALSQSDRYNRKGFGPMRDMSGTISSVYQSGLIQKIRANQYRLQQGDVSILLAESFGFCWGVERAVAMAYQTREHFPTERIWITNEIIHNPSVNDHLTAMDVRFIELKDGQKDFSGVGSGDVVILPAFGASVQEMQLLSDRGCHIIDTTCPWVSKVWNSVEKYKQADYTAIIHGKYQHEETVATTSFAGTYLVVLNWEDAEYVANYILKAGESSELSEAHRAAFLAKFKNACSPGFDPDRDLQRVGVANQTTMMKGETEQIGKLFERTMLQKYGPSQLNAHFMAFNTICDATQERQDAMFKLVDEPLDLLVVIGGVNSSNTTHLQEIAAERGLVSYHIDAGDRIHPDGFLEHKPLGQELIRTQAWLPDGEIQVGITSGASTPDRVVEDVIERIFALKGAVATI